MLCCSSSLLFCCVSIAFLRFGLCFGHLAVAVMLFRAVFHLMSWASLWAYVCSPSASIRLTFPFSAHKQSTTSPCTLLVPLPFRSDPTILRRKRFPTFSGRALRFVSTITAIHESVKPLNHPYKARPAGISNFPGRQYCIHSHIFSFFVLITRTHLLCLSLFPS